uniref:Tetratricopeptide repeat domain 5 n=1 Tax=Scophthalmus maximus TaxID=52904 RepID=A0A8D3DPQ9_SCOMX
HAKMAADEKSGEPVKDKNELHIFKELVDELYNFRDCYFETHSMEEAGRKQSDVMQEMERTLKTLEEKGGDWGVFAGLQHRGLEHAGGAVLEKGDLVGAKNCFTGALQQSKNKVSLRNLSMVLRQLPAADGDTCTKQVLESLDMARQAVQLDVTDGTSWYILGNADVSMFFTGGQNPRFSQQAFGAYAQSEKVDRAASCYPELHFNRATLYQYEEMFGSALDGYSRAAALDPGWKEPPQREKQLLEYLEKVTALVQNKGKVKARRLRTMLSNLNTSALGPCSSPEFRSPTGRVGSLEPRTLSSLSHGHNAGLAALGKVVFSLASEDRMAFTFGMVDSEETCMVVMVYNTADSWGVLIGDTVVIPEPQVKRHSITHQDKTFDFRSIRVDSPLLLIVNGKKQNIRSQIAASVSYKPQSE